MTARVIAIDGPAASGKSSTASAVARRLGWVHIDSGALYRALTWIAGARALERDTAIIAAAESLHLSLHCDSGESVVRVDGVGDVDAQIRSADVTARVSAIAALPRIREWVNAELRRTAERVGGAVIDGRDIGTVVFPDAALKIYLVATPEARAARRLLQRGGAAEPDDVAAEAALLAERDRRDASRATAPLRAADDAVVLDTTEFSFEQQVDAIVVLAAQRGLGQEGAS